MTRLRWLGLGLLVGYVAALVHIAFELAEQPDTVHDRLFGRECPEELGDGGQSSTAFRNRER